MQSIEGSGNGAAGVVGSVKGDPTTKASFGQILSPQHTLCTITRYTGARKGRILNGGHGNWLHGHHGGRAGVAHYNGWKTPVKNQVNPITDWLVFCGQTGNDNAFRANGVDVTTAHGPASWNKMGLTVNQGGCCGARETSDWAIAEVMVWNRELSCAELKEAEHYLLHRLTVGNVVASSEEASTNPDDFSKDGLAAWFQYDAGTLVDASGNGHFFSNVGNMQSIEGSS